MRAAPASFNAGFKLFTYEQWFAYDEREKRDRWMLHLHRQDHIRVTAQLRLGSHWLEIEKGRLARPPLAREQRVCRWCSGAGKREDEAHLLECPHYMELRARLLPEVGPAGWDPNEVTDTAVRRVFAPQTAEGWNKLAEFLLQCRRLKMG